MTNLRPYRFITTIQARSASDLDNKLASIIIPFNIVGLYIDQGIHYAKINPVRPLNRKFIKKSSRNTKKIFDVNKEL